MAPDKKPNSGKGRRGGPRKKADKTAFVSLTPQAGRKRAGPKKRPSGAGGKGRREVAAALIALEELCQQIQKVSEDWKPSDRLDESERETCANQMSQLGEWIESTRDQFLQAQLVSPRDASAKSGCGEVAWAIAGLVRAGVEDSLTTMQVIVRRIHGRMTQLCTPENMAQITDDFRLLNNCVAAIQKLLRKVRGDLRSDIASHKVPDRLKQIYLGLLDAVRNAMADTHGGSLEPEDVQEAFEASLPDRLHLIKELKGVYSRLEAELKEKLRVALKELKANDLSRATDVEDLSSYASEVVIRANGFLTFVKQVWEAGCAGVDARLRQEANTLKEAIDSLTVQQESLTALIQYYRAMIARAPFRSHRRNKPLPAWSAISQDLRDVICALIRLRRDDPEKEWSVVTQKQVEQEMATPLAPITIYRKLQALRRDYEIIGVYKPFQSAEDPNTSNYFWIHDDAFEKYGLEVV